MLIYRLEDKDGIGPFRNCSLKNLVQSGNHNANVDELRSHFNGLPTPRNDGLGTIRAAECCGFASIDQYLLWFKYDWLRTLLNGTFNLVVYQTEQFREGSYQVVFNKSAAKRLWSVPCDNINRGRFYENTFSLLSGI